MYAILSPMINADAMALRQQVVDARAAMNQGRITLDQLYAAADQYIAFLKAYKKTSGKRFVIPSRGYLIRAL
jgi:hypothetical protein